MYIIFTALCAMGWGMDTALDLGRSTVSSLRVSVGLHFRKDSRYWRG